MSINLNKKWINIQQLLEKELEIMKIYLLSKINKINFNNQIFKNNEKTISKINKNIFHLNELIQLNSKLCIQYNFLISRAVLFDYTKKELNGYYSFIRILICLLELFLNIITYLNETKNKLKQNLIHLIIIIKYFTNIIDELMKIFDYNESNKNNDLNLNQSTNLFSKSLNSFAELNVLSLNKDAQKALSLIYGKYNVFWYSKSMQNYFKLLRILILSSNLNTIDAINCVFSSKKCGKKLAFQCSNFTLYNIKKTFKILELPFYNRIYFKILHFNHNQFYKSSTVYFKVKTQFQIPTFDQKEQKILKYLPNNTNEERQIRCRLIKGCTKKFVKKYYQNNLNQQTKINPNKCIIFHVHGGGFVISSPDSHEIYLRKWVTKLNGIPILSVDYKLSSSYPAAIQDILDLYLQLFLINENENNIEKRKYFTDLFGFVSSNVILVGDSCGGNLILSLLCCLNDIKLNYSKLLSQTKLILPFAIVPIYPVFDLRAVTSPSRFIGSLDPILHSTILMTMHGCYGGMFEKKNKFDPKFKWYLSEENKNNQNKFLDKNVKKMYEKMNSRFNTPYSSPLIYKHINNLNIVSLHLIVSQICPLLDDAIEMYKLWTGEKKIYSFSDLPHGFIQFSDLSSECKKATNDIAFTINSLIDDYFSKINQNKN